MRIASTEAPIQASTCLKSKEKLQVRIDSSSSSNKIKNTKNSSQNSISPRPASPNPAAKDLEKSLKPLRSPMKKNSGAGIRHTVNLSRATCSTAIKVARNPDSLELNEPKAKLCTYSYCSLHNQKQEAPLPVVKCFLRAKRQSFEAQNRMNQKKKSSGSKNDPNTVQKIEDERSRDDAEIMDIVCRINGMMLEDCEKSNQLQDFYSVTSFEDYDEEDKNSEISMEMRRIPTENHENNAREFNPRTPRFLPPKTVAAAAAEKVTLKHQPMEERKTAEEWMIDYALRQTLRRIAPARKRKVSLLVAAFESVIQQELKTRG
ncbi:hypothetical protein KSP39_PZI018110 [Platanthera zijinensis]|uniref:Calmodulin-binding domain-containing protein n=1 Tax=Platanthera zijinensis TaxID=2320716 RepID=A0AAP0B2E3_9ASPA